MTKASLLYGPVKCRLDNGELLPATIVELSREHDMAILKVNRDTHPVRWSANNDQELSDFVVLTARYRSVFGTVSQPQRDDASAAARLQIATVK